MDKAKFTSEQLAHAIENIIETEKKARALSSPQSLSDYRKNEKSITDYSKLLDQELLDTLKEWLNDQEQEKDKRYVCFALLFTYYRKNGKRDQMQTLIEVYAQTFKEYYLCDFYALMSMIKTLPIEKYDNVFALLEGDEYKKYNGYIGYMNQYVEICARYYEIHLNRRKEKTQDNQKNAWSKYLEKACEFAETCCTQSDGNDSYAKLHANRGRIYALMGRYGDAEAAISRAIELVLVSDPMYSVTIASFNNFYQNISSIAAYDISAKELQEKADEINQKAEEENKALKQANERQLEEQKQSFTKEMEKLKMENLRNVSAITAVFSLIISGIQAFANLADARSIGRVFSLYASLFFLGIGVIFLVTYLFTREKKSYKNLGLILTAIVCVLAIVAFVLCTFLPF